MPTAANAGYYAGIVAEKALLRRLVEAGTRVVQYGYAGAEGADVAEIVDRAQAEIYDVTERRTSEDFVPLEDLLQPTMDEIDAIASNGGLARGVPTGFTELDEVTNGLHPGQMIIVAARPGVGKALALDTPLPTPTGWTTMGDVAVGDRLLGADGEPTRVVAATDVMLGRPCYEVEFSDGTVIVADAQHQWPTGYGIRTTARIALRCGHHCGGGFDGAVFGARGTTTLMAPVLQIDADAPGAQRSGALRAGGQRGAPVSGRPGHGADAQLDAGPGFLAVVLDQAPDGQRHLLAGNEQVRDRHAAAVGRGEDQARRHAVGPDERRRLDAAGAADERNQRGATVYRRFAEPDDDGDPREGAPAAAEGRARLIVVDYLQLMTSGKKVESRQQEVSEFSAQIKLLAKELEVPVVAISQLNRGPEQRTDKKPMLSDLRESGCLTANDANPAGGQRR